MCWNSSELITHTDELSGNWSKWLVGQVGQATKRAGTRILRNPERNDRSSLVTIQRILGRREYISVLAGLEREAAQTEEVTFESLVNLTQMCWQESYWTDGYIGKKEWLIQSWLNKVGHSIKSKQIHIALKVPWWQHNSAKIFRLVRRCMRLITSQLHTFRARSNLRAFMVPKLILLFTREG